MTAPTSREELLAKLAGHVTRFNQCLADNGWTPRRSHIEGARNALEDAAKALRDDAQAAGMPGDIEEIKGKIARAIYENANEWLAGNFPEDHEFRDFSQVDERTCNLHFAYAEAVVEALSLPSTERGTP